MTSLTSATTSADSSMNLKAMQTGVLHRLLSLHSRDDSSSSSLLHATQDASSTASWKLLIYDRYCQDILSPLLTVNELRTLGITLHMPLASKRERVPDMPAIYFIRPTIENLRLVAADVKSGIYDSTYINFSTSVPSALLEQFATMILQPSNTPSNGTNPSSSSSALNSGMGSASRIVRVMDQYCEFISLEDRLFTLNNPDSFSRLNGATSAASEQDMFAHVEEMVTALFSVCVTSGVVPVIRAKVGHAAELVASKLDTKLREHLASRNNLFTAGNSTAASSSSSSSFHRPLLLLADRGMDLSAPLLHSSTYQSLLHDLMGMNSNRVTVEVVEGTPPKAKFRTYDLLSNEDKFWKVHAGKVFPKVTEGVTERLQAYRTEYNALTRMSGGVDALDGGNIDLGSAITALPKLQRRKKLLDTHMNIVTALTKEIKAREIDVFFHMEQNILQKEKLDKTELAAMFGTAEAPPKGNVIDRLRFLMIYYLQNGINEEQLQQYRALIANPPALSSASSEPNAASTAPASTLELAAIEYIQQYKSLHRLTASSSNDDFSSASQSKPIASQPSGMLGNFSKLADSLYGGGVGLLAASVRNLLPSNNHLPLTRVVEQLMLNKDGGEALDATYKYFDPKSSGRGRVTKVQGSFKECVVFMLGGGTYNEYQNLQDWVKENQQAHGVTSVVYGCSELVSPEQFVKQLANLQNAQQKGGHMPVD